MYPAQTSFIPITVALAKFIAAGGDVWGNYQYWYLGSVPFRYLTGPVVPGILAGLSRVLPYVSLFELSFFLIIVALLIGSFGWGLFSRQITGSKKVGIFVGVLSLVLPWHIVSAFGLGEVSSILATSFGPWVLLLFARIRNEEFRVRNLIPAILAFTILLLINTISSISTIIGLGILAFVLYKHPTEGLKRAGLVVFIGGLLTLWWYSPDYWLKILFAPSFGGRSVIGVVFHLVNLARTVVPIVLALFLVVLKVKPKNNFEKFAFLWLGGFIGLTLVRYMANIHFWLDWTAWMGEIEIGIALVFGCWFAKENKVIDFGSGYTRNQKILVVIFVVAVVVGGWLFAFGERDFWLPRKSIGDTVEFKIAKELNRIIGPNEVVFVSGSSAFWLDALDDIKQVRGGADNVGLGSKLGDAVWEIRNGTDVQRSEVWLGQLGVRYLVVHRLESAEFYHDFSYPKKFEGVSNLKKIYEASGDIIYKIAN